MSFLKSVNDNVRPTGGKPAPAPTTSTAGSGVSLGSRLLIISVEAAIGTGKSSLLRLLQARTGTGPQAWRWMFVQEPVDLWQDVRRFRPESKRPASEEAEDRVQPNMPEPAEYNADGSAIAPAPFNLLHHFYADLNRYAFTFQTCCFLSRIETVRRAIEQLEVVERNTTRPFVLVLERCWHSDRNTFALMLREGGRMSALEWALYDQWYTFAVRNSPCVNSHVYLECSTDTCMSRLRRRDREEESSVSVEYQRALIEKHNTWLDTCDRDSVLRLNVDRDFLDSKQRADDIVHELAEFVAARFAAQGHLVDPEPYRSPSASPNTTPMKDEDVSAVVA